MCIKWPFLRPVGVVVGGSESLQDNTKFSSLLTAKRHESQHALGQAAVIICRATVETAFCNKYKCIQAAQWLHWNVLDIDV